MEDPVVDVRIILKRIFERLAGGIYVDSDGSGTRVIFPGVKRPVREADHLSVSGSLRLSGGIRLLPLYTFVICTGTTSIFYVYQDER